MHILAYATQQEQIPVPPVASIALIHIACTHALEVPTAKPSQCTFQNVHYLLDKPA